MHPHSIAGLLSGPQQVYSCAEFSGAGPCTRALKHPQSTHLRSILALNLLCFRREVEDAIQMAMAGKTLPPYAPGTTGTPGAVPSPGPSSIASGIDQKSTPLLAATPVASAANNGASMGAGTERDNWPSTQGEHAKIGEAFPSTTLRTREQTDDPARSFASLSILFTRSLGKTWWGRGTKAGVAAGSTTARGRDASDFAATVKAAEVRKSIGSHGEAGWVELERNHAPRGHDESCAQTWCEHCCNVVWGVPFKIAGIDRIIFSIRILWAKSKVSASREKLIALR